MQSVQNVNELIETHSISLNIVLLYKFISIIRIETKDAKNSFQIFGFDQTCSVSVEMIKHIFKVLY